MEAHVIIMKHPTILFCIFGMFNLVPRIGIGLSQFEFSYLLLNLTRFGNWELVFKKWNWNFLNHLEVHLLCWQVEHLDLVWIAWEVCLPILVACTCWYFNNSNFHVHAMMQTRMQKVEKFFVFFSTKLGLLQKSRPLRRSWDDERLVLLLSFGLQVEWVWMRTVFCKTRPDYCTSCTIGGVSGEQRAYKKALQPPAPQ